MPYSFSSQDLSVHRGNRHLLDKINFTVTSGEMLRIVGINGSGKTSLIRVLTGLSQADSGHVLWNKKPIPVDELTHKVSYLGHKDGNKFNLTALENLRFHQQLLGKNDENQLLDLLLQTGLLNHADTLAGQLSFGQKRRLAFARLLIAKRPLWLLDEPFIGVDTKGKKLLEELCISHLQEQGMMILTHHGEFDSASFKKYERELDLAQFSPFELDEKS